MSNIRNYRRRFLKAIKNGQLRANSHKFKIAGEKGDYKVCKASHNGNLIALHPNSFKTKKDAADWAKTALGFTVNTRNSRKQTTSDEAEIIAPAV